MARILLIDDEEDVRTVVAHMLATAGHDVVAVANPAAFRQVRDQPFDLLVTDMMMPDLDGVEVMAQMRKHQPKLKILVMSGGVWQDKFGPLDVAARLGADLCIAKPFRQAQLLAAVKTCLAVPPGASN